MIMFSLFSDYFWTFNFYDLVNASSFQMFYLGLWFVSFALYRIFLCLTIHSSAKEREVKYRFLWSLLTFLFGVIIPIIYAVVNRKNKTVKRYKSKNIFLVFSIILIALSYSGAICYNLSNTGEFEHTLDPQTTVDDLNNKVIYDKKGNKYLYKDMNFLYYDENGNSYKWVGDRFDTLVSIESGKEYKMEDYLYCINQDGDLCIFDYDSESIHYSDIFLIYDDNGNLYYDYIWDVYWDEKGNVVFPKFVREFMFFQRKWNDLVK